MENQIKSVSPFPEPTTCDQFVKPICQTIKQWIQTCFASLVAVSVNVTLNTVSEGNARASFKAFMMAGTGSTGQVVQHTQ